ncbi:MAG: hypothetical protein M3P26_10540 [Gemmatimonadota bacterium]|nr:hypothetical protein [Gemmatimonadota bacterium]
MRTLKRLAWILGFGILLAAPAAAGAQTRHFTVPDSLHKLEAALPWGSQYLADAKYDRWWHEIAECERLPLPSVYATVRFFQINAIHFYDADRPTFVLFAGELRVQWAVAMSFLWTGEIWVGLPYINEEVVIKHEMVHFLMYWAGEPGGHPPARFETCGVTTEWNGP